MSGMDTMRVVRDDKSQNKSEVSNNRAGLMRQHQQREVRRRREVILMAVRGGKKRKDEAKAGWTLALGGADTDTGTGFR